MDLFLRSLRKPPAPRQRTQHEVRQEGEGEGHTEGEESWAFWPKEQQMRIHFVRGVKPFGMV